MNRTLGIVLIVVGLALLFFGMQESESFSSGVSRLFTGSPTDRTIAFLVGGLAASAAGVFLLLRGRKA